MYILKDISWFRITHAPLNALTTPNYLLRFAFSQRLRVVIVSRTVNVTCLASRARFGRIIVAYVRLFSLVSTLWWGTHLLAHFHPRFSVTAAPLDARRGEGEQCTAATERSYVDLSIVRSGWSSVGGELVGWLHGVWPHNHSYNDSLFSFSLAFSLAVSQFLFVASLLSRFIVSRDFALSLQTRLVSLSPRANPGPSVRW